MGVRVDCHERSLGDLRFSCLDRDQQLRFRHRRAGVLEHELDDAERGSRDYYAIRDDLIDVVKTANGKRAVWQSVPQSDYVVLGSEVSVGRQASDSVAPVLPINPADVFRTTRRPFLVLDRFPVAFACPSLQPERPLLALLPGSGEW